MLFLLHDNQRQLLSGSRLIWFGPEAPSWDEDLPQSSMEEPEEVEYTPVVQNTDEASQNALLDFYDAVNTRELSVKQARKYERKVFNILSDHFLDKAEVKEINEMVNEIKDKIEKWNDLIDKLDQSDSKNDFDIKQLVREQCYNWKTGKISFRGSRKLENKISLSNIFDGKYLKIQIDESRRSAKQRGIPENAIKDGDFYLLKKVGENYVYETPDDSNIKATVHNGDIVKEGIAIDNSSRAVDELKSEDNDGFDETARNISTYERMIGKQLYSVTPVSSSEMFQMGSGVPFTKEEGKSFGSISSKPSKINPAENIIRTKFPKLMSFLVTEFSKNNVSLKKLGIKHDIRNLTPGEAQKFTQFLMRSKLKNRATDDVMSVEADLLGITELFNSNVPLVCRNSAQVFEGCIKALKRLSSGKLDSMQVSTVSAGYYEGEAGSVGQPNDHAWNVVYVKKGADDIVITVVDEFQVASGNKGDRTKERALLSELNDTKDPQDLVDNFAFKVIDFISKIESEGSSAITQDAWDACYNKYTALINLENVDTDYLEQQMDTLKTVLEENSNKGPANRLSEAQGVKYCMKMGKTNQPLFLDKNTWRDEISRIKKGTIQLIRLYKMALGTAEGAEMILANWNLTKEKLKTVVYNLWDKITSVDPVLFENNADYNFVVTKFKKNIQGLKSPEIKYASREIEDREAKA